MAARHESERLRGELRAAMKRMKSIDTKEGAGARLLFHRLAVELGMQSSVPPWVLQNAREKGVLK